MAEQGDSHMEELVDQGLGMEEETHELLRRPSLLRETYHSDSLLLAPDTDFLTDDRSSAASGLDVADRLTYLEQRMQMQEDEIQLLKMALADVLKRLNISEEHQAAAAGKRMPGAKARPVSLALPSRAPMVSSSAASLKKSTTLPSASTGRNYSPSPTPSKSGMKSPVGSVKDGLCRSGKARPFSASTSAASTCRSTPDSSSSIKAKEPSVTLGTRRVIHCKVTMQIYLSPHARRTGSSEITQAMAGVPADGGSAGAAGGPRGAREGVRKLESRKMPPTITLNLQKATSGQATALIASNYKSPIMSPSQYFQICY